ncbi:hypothetical protein SUGI_0955100 [Cryptomeria japonica]|uniref:uncharacterized protein LOC131051279 n=1 Tax=Cryptomeria japonica TaxID=3369 RepID=UPI002414A412|nr:uncharacterized protein LOC131051279 [Cryptomeria japonica]XP_057841704.2 uncharacterized protein LOC131051279 [Cryptomeria japonica]XP_057841705.2 uncharacterized protein LOC131051279 [Cryptomeria japonica]XP_057841706.2 uncharacterized protein LOC131051279 [Cryptomeria japonica]GLJ45371.1 hypothetical protein SUGI_0955100 [Cryptomeria japonica]
MERGSRYTSPHNSQEDCLWLSRRKGIMILSPTREESRRAHVGLAEFYSSGARSELVKNERFPTSSVNKFRQSFNEAERDCEFRLASHEVPNPDELISSLSHRGHCSIYSPSHHCNAEEDVCYNCFSCMRNKAMGKDLELTEDKKDNQFASMWGEGIVLDGCGILLKKPIVLGDGRVRPFFLLPPETPDSLCNPKSYDADNILGSKKVTPCSIGNADFGYTNSVASQFGEESQLLTTDSSYKLQCARLSHGQDKLQCSRSNGEVFEKEERDIFNYSRRAVYPFSFLQSEIPAVTSESSSLPRGLSYGEHTSSLHARFEDFSNTKLCEAIASERHGQRDTYSSEAIASERHRQRDTYSKENSSVLHTGNCSSNDFPLYSTRQVHGGVVAACTENIRRDSSHIIPMPHDNYNKGKHIPCHNYNDSPQRQESWQCGSVRPHSDVQINDCMENTTNLRKHFIGENEDMAVQNDPLDDHGDIYRSFSPRAITSGLNGDLFRSSRRGLPSVLRVEVSRSPLTRHAREEYSFGKNDFVMDFEQAARDHFPEAAVDLHKSSLSSPSRSKLSIGGLDKHGYEKRVLKRKYIAEDNHRGGLQQRPLNDQGRSRKLRKMDLHENGWVDKEGTSRSSIHSQRHRNFDTISISVNNSSDMQRKKISKSKPQIKFSSSLNLMKINCNGEDKSDYRNYEQDIHHPCNSQKHKSECIKQDRFLNKYREENDLVNDRDPVQLSDLPEDSEKFKQKVQKAFLRFVKILNENPGECKIYEENGRYGSLLCIVCSSLSKVYGTTHSLVTHAFNCQKVVLRAEHLGLHKALCVIMGWNYAVVPDNAYVYQSLAKPDAIAIKEDLILWPPLVIIHTYTFKNKQDECQIVTSNLEMDDILRELGFSSGKSKAVDCSTASRGTYVVKFSPTYSGLQEAQRLHKYCEEKHRGRNNWVQLQSQHKSQQGVGKKPRQLQDDRHAENGKIFGKKPRQLQDDRHAENGKILGKKPRQLQDDRHAENGKILGKEPCQLQDDRHAENGKMFGKKPHQLQDDRHVENGKIFYGYTGIAGDLDKVDFDTKKRSLVKSRKDIEAIACDPVLGA